MKVRIKLGKVKKFGIGWCIPHKMAADNAEGGSGQTPPAGLWAREQEPREKNPENPGQERSIRNNINTIWEGWKAARKIGT